MEVNLYFYSLKFRKMIGNITKMRTENDNVVKYYLTLGDKSLLVNDLIGKKIRISYTGTINCIKCGRKTNKSFAQGFCYPCFLSAPEADPGIMRPELDMAHKGISRDMEWAKTFSLADHFVYLAYSSNLKVGVTRFNQIPTRWIDQGAVKAIIVAKTPYRNLAGQIEVALKEHYADKTNWRKMLQNVTDVPVDFIAEKQRAISFLPEELQEYAYDIDDITNLSYPVEQYPEKVKSVNLEKTPVVEKTLAGIKAQYFIFDDNSVMNIRKYTGYKLELEVL